MCVGMGLAIGGSDDGMSVSARLSKDENLLYTESRRTGWGDSVPPSSSHQSNLQDPYGSVPAGRRVYSPAPSGLDAQLPTPTPKVDETLVAPPYIEPATPDNIEGIICSFDWPQGCDYWIGMAMCESSLRPDAVGYGGWYVGLFQVWLGHSYSLDWLSDPSNNALAAWEISHEGTYTGAWPYCQ